MGKTGANPKLFETIRPIVGTNVAPNCLNRHTTLGSVLGFSEQVLKWVKKSDRTLVLDHV